MDLDQLNHEIIACRKCPRLVEWREQVARGKRRAYRDQEYWGKPVPGFGDLQARILIVGLAPGAHGSNRTGRAFTGDGSGKFLYPSLYRAGLASQPDATSREDGLTLSDVYITAVARCAPPANKPAREELDNCQPYLEHELQILQPKVIVVLGRIAFGRILQIYSARGQDFKFGHAAAYRLPHRFPADGPWLLASYHPSLQNTQTGRLTTEMFDSIWASAKILAGGE
jgi:uracil-DNA glycosylase family 4